MLSFIIFLSGIHHIPAVSRIYPVYHDFPAFYRGWFFSFFSFAIRSMRHRVVLLTPSSLAISCFFFLDRYGIIVFLL